MLFLEHEARRSGLARLSMSLVSVQVPTSKPCEACKAGRFDPVNSWHRLVDHSHLLFANHWTQARWYLRMSAGSHLNHRD